MAKLTKITRAGGPKELCERRLRFNAEGGRLIARLHSMDGRGTDYHVEINANELINLAAECCDVVNSNNKNCPSHLALVWK